jgi:hypothetical protein
MTEPSTIASLLRAIASGANAREARHDAVLIEAAEMIENGRAEIDEDALPIQADSVGIHYCTDCGKPHLDLALDDGTIFATAALSNELIEEMVQYIKAHRQ